ncbi:MAG: carotenoid biosynthesis protein [Putridiphycobacter sp.]
MPKSIPKIIGIFIIIIYVVGAFGHALPDYLPQFLALTPISLILTFVMYLLMNQTFNWKLILAILGLSLLTITIEIIGVKTGLLFGEYFYGRTLGFKFMDVPLIIGLNWVLLNFSGYGAIQPIKTNRFIRAALSSAIIVLLDILIEPIAMKLDYWHWKNDDIPTQNFLTWFLVSFLIQLIIDKLNLKLNYKASLIILAVQFFFFGFLNIML